MKVHVEMFAFGAPGELREVEVPGGDFHQGDDEDCYLEEVFYYGQNDFQPRAHPSVSVGDVIHLDNRFYLVEPVGFRELTAKQVQDLRRIALRK